jgi:DNA integrity scanning protein DisA with diadenylate cyclase activity
MRGLRGSDVNGAPSASYPLVETNIRHQHRFRVEPDPMDKTACEISDPQRIYGASTSLIPASTSRSDCAGNRPTAAPRLYLRCKQRRPGSR